jgi:hypothetical protein
MDDRAAFSVVMTFAPSRLMVLKIHGMASERVISVLAPPGSARLTVTPVPSSLRASSYVQSALISFALL